MAASKTIPIPVSRIPLQERDELTIRFAGDSGDGMQLAGTQFTSVSALTGNHVSTLPDYPAEIRAPAGSLAGVSGFQVHVSKHAVHTPGDVLDALVAMNPAALHANLKDLQAGGILIVNADAFANDDLQKAGFSSNPLGDGSLDSYRLLAVHVNQRNCEAVAPLKLSPREADRCKNFFVLGLVYCLFEKPLEPTLRWIEEKFARNPAVLEANSRTLKAGYHYGASGQVLPVRYRVPKADIMPGQYRTVTGTEALALGLVSAAQSAGLPLVFAASPITPASDLMHTLANLKHYGIRNLQAEDAGSALSMVLGASFGGALGVTATSGPGMSLSAEALGLAVMAELPCIVIDFQRGGPSTGLPTKTEQADLLQAMFGRHGECPLVILAPASPADGFAVAFEATRLAVRYMTPVVVLTDGFLANSAEPWQVPSVADLPVIQVARPSALDPKANGSEFGPYQRDARLARPWAIPGTPGLEHRIGGLEKEDQTGNVSYDPRNHEKMVELRAAKIANIAGDIPPLNVDGPEEADLLVIGWGGTFGAIATAVKRLQAQGRRVACAHVRYLNPLPPNTGAVLKRYPKILVPELNGGQLLWLLRARFLVDAVGYGKVLGTPFLIREIEAKIEEMLIR